MRGNHKRTNTPGTPWGGAGAGDGKDGFDTSPNHSPNHSPLQRLRSITSTPAPKHAREKAIPRYLESSIKEHPIFLCTEFWDAVLAKRMADAVESEGYVPPSLHTTEIGSLANTLLSYGLPKKFALDFIRAKTKEFGLSSDEETMLTELTGKLADIKEAEKLSDDLLMTQ